MPEAITEYLLFLAKTLTLVVAILVVVGIIAAAASRRGRPHARLRVRDLGSRYDRTAANLRAAMLPRAAAKKHVKAERKRRKTEQKQLLDPGHSPRPRVFVLDFHGDVRASRVSGLREEVTAILAVARPGDEVLLRLHNPGGLVNEQGLAASQLLRIRSRDLPLTVAVDSVAASGGYMMACVASRIVAAPFAVIGSIGVVTAVPNFHRLLDRAGVDVEQFTGGEFKRTVTMFGRNTDEDRAKLREQIEDTHALFKEFVGEHRPQVDLARAATGEYWYGARAVELRLVDELLTSDDYLLRARERADLYELSWVTPPSIRGAVGSAAAAITRPFSR